MTRPTNATNRIVLRFYSPFPCITGTDIRLGFPADRMGRALL